MIAAGFVLFGLRQAGRSRRLTDVSRLFTDNASREVPPPRVQWSPDGERLVFAIIFASFSDPPNGRALYVINADGTGQRQLNPWSLGAHGIPDWSAKTNRIAFRAVEDEEEGKGNFFTIGPDGKNLTQVTHFTDTVISHKVGFSPDGKWITFGKRATNGAGNLFTIKVDGTNLQPVTHAPEADTSPDWAPTR